MAENRAQRHLAAVLAADVAGYSRLMGVDEIETLRALKRHRKDLINPMIAAYRGRTVKTTGDGMLVEFASVVDAISCGIAIQRGMSARNRDIPQERRIEFRVGINIGDIIVDEKDIYGDGVNVAARLEALAQPGGVCVSKPVRDQVRDKLAIGFDDLGEQTLKNIARPMRIFGLTAATIAALPETAVAAPGPQQRRLVPLGIAAGFVLVMLAAGLSWYLMSGGATVGDRKIVEAHPTIAVLPFANLSGDPSQDYFADGITEDLITDLAKLSGLVVIAHNSVFAYKGRPIVLQDVARDLGVRYVVEGSVRRSGDRIHVNARLIDTATGGHLVVKEFDRSASDIFAVEDEVVAHIVGALGVQPTASEKDQLVRPPTANLEAYDYYLRGEQAARTGLLREALELYAKATTLDPSFADAYAADARTSVDIWRNVFDDILPGPVARKRAYEKAGRALELNPESSRPYAILAGLQVVDRRYEEALASARRAVALGPSDSEAHAALSLVLTFDGDHADAVAAIETAQQFNPNLSMGERQVAGMAFLLHGDYARAIETLERARVEALRGEVGISGLLAAAYARAGRLNEARGVAAEARRTTPAISIALWRVQYAHFRNGQDLEHLLEAMHDAGIPEWPFDFRADDRDRLSGADISQLAFGRTWQGRTEAGESALLQFGRDGKTAFRTPTQIVTGTAFVDRDMLCQQSENVLLGRPRCGPVYRRTHGAAELAYTYVNAFTVFHFSPVE
jgi:adenylate cyclase